MEEFNDDKLLQEEFYINLKNKLEVSHNFPENYVFKFIFQANSEKLGEILALFDGLDFTLSNKESSGGKYSSITLNCFVLDSEQVISIYKKVGALEGVMML